MKLQAIAKLNSEFDNLEKKLIDDIRGVKKEALATLRKLDRANRINN
jgi:hypothetical protein